MENTLYGIKEGQIYIAADGSRAGHIVTDITTYANCNDVVTTPFTASGMKEPGNRIDCFKLAMARYYLADVQLEWFPKELRKDSYETLD